MSRSIYEVNGIETSQISRDIIGKVQRISNDIAAPVPNVIDVGSPVTTVFNISDLQRETVNLVDDVESNTSPVVEQIVWGGNTSTLAAKVRSAKFFSLGRCSFTYHMAAGANLDLNVSLNVLFNGPGGTFSVCVKNDFIQFIGNQTTPISLGEIQDMFFENARSYWEQPSSESGSLQFGSVQFLFDFRAGAGAFEIRDAYVPLQLYY